MKQDTIKLDIMRREIDRAKKPDVLIRLEGELDAFERHLKASGFLDEIGPVREARMRARWRLGQMFATAAPGHGPGRGKKESGERNLLFGLAPQRVTELIRLGDLPAALLEQAFAECREDETLPTQRMLTEKARPYWAKTNREKRHLEIRCAATKQQGPDHAGPFPLIYADPPWKFEAYSELGKEYSPEAHYPCEEYDELKTFCVGDKLIQDVSHDDAALFLWCTSSNMHHALDVMTAWGFEFKTSAVWDKGRTGTGYVFLNQHEVLLYGTKGSMAAPMAIRSSLFAYPRGEHSAKPPEVRAALDEMYPHFGAEHKIELFCRDAVPGWSVWGYEA